ncbi:unnamed protein product [Ascophyllum nodosum]
MLDYRAFKYLCILLYASRRSIAFLPQTGSIRLPVASSSSLSGYVSDASRGHQADRLPRRCAVARRSRAAAGRLMMRQTEEEAAKTKMRLRVEAESPFRKVRIFIFSAFVISATVGFIVSGTRLLALTAGINQGQDFQELGTNIVIDLAAIGISAWQVKRDVDAQDGRLARMEIGAKLAGLKIRLQQEDDKSMVTLSALRRDRGRDKRVAVLVGGLETVRESLESALPYGEALETSDILIVPLVLEARPGGGSAGAPATDPSRFQASGRENDLEAAVGRAHVAMPVALNRWQEYVDTEVETALSQGIDPLNQGFSLVLKKNGRIGARSKGCPPWGTLVSDVKNRELRGMDTKNI